MLSERLVWNCESDLLAYWNLGRDLVETLQKVLNMYSSRRVRCQPDLRPQIWVKWDRVVRLSPICENVFTVAATIHSQRHIVLSVYAEYILRYHAQCLQSECLHGYISHPKKTSSCKSIPNSSLAICQKQRKLSAVCCNPQMDPSTYLLKLMLKACFPTFLSTIPPCNRPPPLPSAFLSPTQAPIFFFPLTLPNPR